MPGYRLIGSIHSSIHGSKISLVDHHVTYQDHKNHVHVLAVEVNRNLTGWIFIVCKYHTNK
jgi:oligoribonuclease NrnB/cAMP/cGMP phosphodiesterase (DHH superfamily)